MVKYCAAILAILFSFSNCFADTFIHRQTGEKFNGYYLQRKRANKTQVRIKGGSPQYLDLSRYEIQRNHLGRKNSVSIFAIKDSISLECETEAFEKAIALAANQGPLFILIEIDSPQGRLDLSQRICSAITKVNNCDTVAFVSGGKFGGAFSTSAIVALACDKVYMRKGTTIGGTAPYVQVTSGDKELEETTDRKADEKSNLAWAAYCAAVAERKGRPGTLVRAMTDEDIELVEVAKNGERFFIDLQNKKPEQKLVRTWSKKGLLLSLPAAEAVRCAIADKMVASREELFADLDAAKARQVNDRRVFKARRSFEREQRRIERILSSINYLKEQAETIAKQVEAIEDDMRRLSYRPAYRPVDILEQQRMFIARDELLAQMLRTLEELMVNCERAIERAKKHPDLEHHIETIEKDLEAAETKYRKARPRSYWRY